MRIFIAGPTLGHEDTYKAVFAAAADTLRKGGHEPVNPTILAELPAAEEMSWSDYMDAALPMLATCQGIYLLPGWRTSRGARVEATVAQILRLRRFGVTA